MRSVFPVLIVLTSLFAVGLFVGTIRLKPPRLDSPPLTC